MAARERGEMRDTCAREVRCCESLQLLARLQVCAETAGEFPRWTWRTDARNPTTASHVYELGCSNIPARL